MSGLFIFDNHDRLVQVLSNESQGATPFWEARYKQILSDMSTFEFLTEAKVDVPAGYQVAFSDKDGMFRLFEITERVRNVGRSGIDAQYYCQDAMHDLSQNYIMDRRPQNVTLRQAAEVALEGQSRWRLGQVMDLGLNSTNYYRESSLSALSKLVERWGAEIRPRVEVSNGRIVGRFIDLVRIGTDTGLVLEVGHDVEGMEFSVTTDHIRTRMYGQGASLPVYDGNGVPTGGNTRLIMFEDVQALPGDGFAKPLGQLFVEDEEARQKFGLVVNGQRQHREGMFSDGTIQDGRELMLRTWEHLQSNSHPHYHVQLTVVDLSLLEGEDFSHRRLSIGDMVRLVDHETFGETVAVESRVYSYEYDLADGTRAVIEFGNFRDLYDNPEFRNMQREVAAIRDRPALPSDGTNIIAPVAPVTNFQATGLFASILLGWDSQRLGVQFELHASQVQGFLPGPFNLIYRGPVNMFTHASATPVGSPGAAPPPTGGNPALIPPPGVGIPGPVNPPGLGIPGNPVVTFNAPAPTGPRENQTWYYRVRAVNNAGLASDWSPEVSGQTANTTALDELESSLRGLEESVYQAYLRAGAAIEEADSAWWLAHDALMLASDEARISTIVRSETSGLQSEVVQMAGAWGAFVRDEGGSPLSSLLATRDIVDMRVNGEAGSTFFQVSDGRTVIRSDAIVLDGDTIVRGTFTVLGGNLADGSVTGVKIANGAVTATQIAANTIAANNIASNAILTRHIQVGTLHGDRIQAGTITSGMLVAGTITTINLANNAVTANQIADGSVTGVKIAGGAVAATHIAANAITAAHIAAGAISANVITAGTMNGARIQAGTITADRLAAGAITAGMITAGTMSASRITGGTMVASNLNIHPAGGSTNNAILIQASNHRLVGRQSQGGGSQVRDSFILTNTELRFNDWNNLATATFNPDGFRMHRRMLSGAATNEQCFSLTTHRRSAGDWNTWMTAGSGTGTASAGEHRVQFRNTNRVVVAEFGQEWQSFSVQGYLNVWRNANNVGGTVWSYGFHQHSTQEMKADIEAVPAGTVGTGLSLIEQVKVSEFSYLYHPEEGRVTARNRSSCLKSSERVLGAIAEENASIQSPGEQNLGVDLTKVLWNCVLAIQELSQQNECLRMQVKALSQT